MAAGRGRDLTISILSDLDKFDTEKAARELEDLGDSAKDMGEEVEDAAKKVEKSLDDISADKAEGELKDLEAQADKTAKGMDDEFDSAAKKIDAAFDKIAASSRSNLRKVDDEAGRAKKGMGDFKDETTQVGREASTSFTGDMEDISDALRDVSANALSAFGPAGALVGIAAAAALGGIIAQLQSAADEAERIREETSELTKEIYEAGGALDEVDFPGKMRDWSLEIENSKSWWEVWQQEATTNLEMVDKALEDSGVKTEEYLAAFASADTERQGRVLSELTTEMEDLNDQRDRYLEQNPGIVAAGGDPVLNNLNDEIKARENLIQTLRDLQDQQATSTREAEILAEAEYLLAPAAEDAAVAMDSLGLGLVAVEEAAEDTNVALEAAQETLDVINGDIDKHALAVEEAARRVAIANGESGDSWEDYKDDAVVSLEDVIAAEQAALDERIRIGALEATVRTTQGEELLGIARYYAEEYNIPYSDALQEIIDMPTDRLEELKSTWAASGQGAGEAQAVALEGAISAGSFAAKLAAAGVRQDVEDELSGPITMPTDVSGPSQAAINAARAEAKRKWGVLTMPTRLGTPGNANLLRRTWL